MTYASSYYLLDFVASDVCQRSAKHDGTAIRNRRVLQCHRIATSRRFREQKRIVGILDEAFEGIATAKANAEKNLQNARALFESHLQSVFTRRGPGGWISRLGKSATDITDGVQYQPREMLSKTRLLTMSRHRRIVYERG